MSPRNQVKETPALAFRNKKNGGNLLFRPVGLLPTVQAAIEIHRRTNQGFDEIFSVLNRVDMTISNTPWKNVLWNPNEKTMIMGTSIIVKLMLLYMFGLDVIRENELTNLKEKYSDKINADNVDLVLADIDFISN